MPTSGELAKSRRVSEGANIRAAQDETPSHWFLPIFCSKPKGTWTGIDVRNGFRYVPRFKEAERGRLKAEKFWIPGGRPYWIGEDDKGWGILRNFSVTCVNIPACKVWRSYMKHDWGVLFDREGTPQEKSDEYVRRGVGQKAAAERLLVTVNLDAKTGGIQMDAALKLCVVAIQRSGNEIAAGATGFLVFKNALDQHLTKYRLDCAVVETDPKNG